MYLVEEGEGGGGGLLTVTCSVFLSSNKSFWVEEASVRSTPDFVYYIGLKVDVQGTGHVFARGSL